MSNKTRIKIISEAIVFIAISICCFSIASFPVIGVSKWDDPSRPQWIVSCLALVFGLFLLTLSIWTLRSLHNIQ